MKLCIHCKHIGYDKYKNPVCKKEHSPVNGEPLWFCIYYRHVGWLAARIQGFCGKEARFFEPKEEKCQAQLENKPEQWPPLHTIKCLQRK